MAETVETDLLTTDEVAKLLRIHPKHVYRLIRRGLPGRRVGREWRFDRREVLVWLARESPGGGLKPEDEEGLSPAGGQDRRGRLPPIIAAHGGTAIEVLVRAVRQGSSQILGMVPADRGEALAMLARGQVLVAGFHGPAAPAVLDRVRLARIHLVDREIGLVARPGRQVEDLADLVRIRLASRPPSAGVRYHLDEALRRAGLDPVEVHGKALLFGSHEEVVFAVARGDADVGITTRCWADRLGLGFRFLTSEAYVLLVRAGDLGDTRIVRLCEIAQGGEYRRALRSLPGHDVGRTGDIRFDPEPAVHPQGFSGPPGHSA